MGKRMKMKIRLTDTRLGYWLTFVSHHVTQAFQLKLEGHKVTVAEWVILRELYNDDSVVSSRLATRLGVTAGRITRLTDRLAAKSLITKKTNKDNRRFQVLALTRAGRALVPVLSALAERNDAEFFGHLEAAQRKRLQKAMKDLVRHHEFGPVLAE